MNMLFATPVSAKMGSDPYFDQSFATTMKTLLHATLVLTIAGTATAQVPGLSGTLVVTNKSPATATIIDVATGRALATLPTGNGPHEVVLSSNGRTAVVTD